nr:hypothetical protein [Tanacetum cinerariifolium]
MASIFGSKSKSSMTMSISSQDESSINRPMNDPKDFAKPVKAISFPQYVPSTSDHHLIELENQVQRLMKAHLAPKQPVQVIKSLIHVRSVVVPTTLNTAWKVTSKLLLSMRPSVPTKQEASGSCVNIIPLYLFKKLNLGLLEETDHVFGLADGTKSYPVRIVRDVEVHIGRLKLLNGFYIIDMKKDPETPLLVRIGFLATANTVIDCRKAKIAVGEGITRSVFGVKGIKLGENEAPYLTTLGKRESHKSRPCSDSVGARTSYYAKKEFMNYHLPEEWEISRDAKINPFKDVLIFKRMMEFLGAIPINLKRNMGESEDLIETPIN